MKRYRLNTAVMLIACLLLLAPCGRIDSLAAIPAAKSAGLSGYDYGQSLWVVNCKESISLRTKASTSSEAILQIPLYARVSFIADADNGFLMVNYNGTNGYALSEYLDEFEPQIAIGEYMQVYNCKKSITLREKPSTKAAEICQIPLGEVVYVIKDAANDFFMVKYRDLEGYALSSYLKSLNSDNDANASSETGYYYSQPLWVAGVNESISLRTKDSTSSEAVLQIPLYAQVIYIRDASNGFVYVVYNGVAGYALSKYLDEFEPQIAIGEYRQVVKCRESITLRKTASKKGADICQIPLGDVVYVIKDAANGFYMVEYNGMQGYVLKEYIGNL